MKTCSRCGEEKPSKAFTRHTASRDGLYPRCRSCRAEDRAKIRDATSAYNARYHEMHREEIAARKALTSTRRAATMQARKRRAREVLDRIKMEQGCAVCSEEDPIVLQFHHRDPSKKIKPIGRMLGEGKALPTILSEVAKCDVLCANCHARVTWGTRDLFETLF